MGQVSIADFEQVFPSSDVYTIVNLRCCAKMVEIIETPCA